MDLKAYTLTNVCVDSDYRFFVRGDLGRAEKKRAIAARCQHTIRPVDVIESVVESLTHSGGDFAAVQSLQDLLQGAIVNAVVFD
jgi:hypothetical protein